LSPQAIALVLNAYARAGQQDEALFSHMSAMIQQMSSGSSANLTPQSVANILNACAAGNFRDEALLKRLSSGAFPDGVHYYFSLPLSPILGLHPWGRGSPL